MISIHTLFSARQKAWLFQLMYLPYMMRDMLFCWSKGLTWHSDWRFFHLPMIRIKGRGSVLVIGRKFVACSDPEHNSLGVFQRVILKTVGHGATITIGDDVGMSGCTISAGRSITIGNHVLLGSGCLITDNDAHPIDPDQRRLGGGGIAKPIVIEDDVFIGARAIILKGVTIGRGSVVGAGAVVAKSIPPFSIAVGNPARVIGDSRHDHRSQGMTVV